MRHCLYIMLFVSLLLGCGRKDEAFVTDFKTMLSFPIRTDYKTGTVCRNEIVIGLDEPPVTTNAFFASTPADLFLRRALNGTLVYCDHRDGSIRGMLAESFTVSPDQRIFSFVLRQGLHFSDGTPLESADVRESLELLNKLLKGTKAGTLFLNADNDLTADCTDTRTITVTLRESDSHFLEGLTNYPVYKKSDLSGIADYHVLYMMNDFIGAGPYMIGERSSDRIVLRRNSYYYATDTAPVTQTLVLRSYRERSDLINHYLDGGVDLFAGTYGDYEGLKGIVTRKPSLYRIIDTGVGDDRIIAAYHAFKMEDDTPVRNEQCRKLLADLLARSGDSELLALSGIGSLTPYKPYALENSAALLTHFTGQTLAVIALDGTPEVRAIAEKGMSLLKEQGINAESIFLDTPDFIKRVFYDKNYDIALFPYEVTHEQEAPGDLYSPEFPGFYPFFEDDSYSQAGAYDFDKLNFLFYNKAQFVPVFARHTLFFARHDIANFYYNAAYGTWPDLLTVERLAVFQ